MLLHAAKRSTGIALIAATLTACGGGGDGMSSPTPAPQASYDLHAAMAALVQTGLASTNVKLSGNVDINGTSTPFTGTGTFTLTAGSSGTFNHMSARLQTENISGTVTAAGQSSAYAVSVTNAYDAATGNFLGESQGGEIDVAQSPIQFPMAIGTTVTPLGTISRYTDNTLSVVLGTTDLSVGVTLIPVDAGSPEVVQFTYKTYDTNHALIQTDTISFRLSPSSVLTFYAATTENSSGTVSVMLQ